MLKKYKKLFDYFKSCDKDDFMLTFAEIEEIMGDKLPASSYVYSANWSNNDHESLSATWKPNHYYSYGLNLDNKTVHFRCDLQSSVVVIKRKRRLPKISIPTPTIEEVNIWLKEWDRLPDYTVQESAIKELFTEKYPQNTDLKSIMIKCSVLNDFYSTNIFKIYPVACHIRDLRIDERLKIGDTSLVKEIATVKIEDKIKDFYSFATKYCSHHNQNDFPIYDSYVDKVLRHFRDVDEFYNFENNDLKDYKKFKEILIAFKGYYGLDVYSLKDLDKYLWQIGKKYFKKQYKKKAKKL